MPDNFLVKNPAADVLSTPPAPKPLDPDKDLREFSDTTKTRQWIHEDVHKAISAIPPLSDDKHTLKLSKVRYIDPERFTRQQRKHAVLAGETLGRRIKGTWELSDNATGAVVDRRDQVVARVPYLSSMGTFTIRGNDYSLNSQPRLDPGSYTRIKANGDLENHTNIRVGTGPAHRYLLDPEKGVFKIKIGQAEMPLMPLLEAMGASDKELHDAWGPELHAANSKVNDASVLTKLQARLLRKSDLADGATPTQALVRRFENMEMDPEINRSTLGVPHARLTKDAILDITRKLLAVSRGEQSVDDRDHLAYQTLYGPEDLFRERIERDHGRLRHQAFWHASREGNLAKMPSGLMTAQLEQAILGSGLGLGLEEINPSEVLDKQSRMTRMGEGGISTLDAVPEESRGVQPSHYGFVDPIRSPESFRAGVDTNAASGARKGRDGQIYAQFVDKKTGQAVWMSPRQLKGKAVGFPGNPVINASRVPAMKDGKLTHVKHSEVDVVPVHFEHAFSDLSNLVPMKSMAKPQRVSMGARMLTQALPLVNAEAPLVRSAVPGTGGSRSYEQTLAKHMGAVRADKGGVVTDFDPEEGVIHVKYDDNLKDAFELYRHHPFSRKTFWHQEPVLAPGSRFAPGQLLARSNYTDAEGATALGLNARTAYIPWHGLNYEDAKIISESMAKRLTSEHAYQHDLDITDKHKLGKKNFTSLFPATYERSSLAKLDDRGVIQPGEQVEYGEPLILAAHQRELAHNKVHKPGQAGYGDASITWDHHDPGVVTDVVWGRSGPTVMVKARSPMQIGDKMSGRFGDKGVVASIIPDDQMPRDSEGKPFEVLENPLGVISRANPSQMAELWLGKIAAHTGKPINVADFETADDMAAHVEQELRKHGLKDTEDIVDPVAGRKIPNVAAGTRFFMKLHHTSESKLQGRDSGAYTLDDAPAKGGATGSKRVSLLDTNALLAHGAVATLRDAGAIRGQRNEDYWLQFMQGHSPRDPDVPFVYDKFMNFLKAAGINPVRAGTRTHLMALTNSDITKLAGDRVISSGATVNFDRGMQPVPGGLFDEQMTGGHGGKSWSAYPLDEPMPSPVMEEPIRRLLGLTQQKYEDVIAGKHEIPGHGTGPQAIGSALDAINVPREIENARVQVSSGTKTARDMAVRKLGYLKAAQQHGLHLRDWMLDKIPVLPPAYRPVSVLGDSGVPLVADANTLYKDAHEANENLKAMKGELGDAHVGPERLALYHAFKAVTGLGDPITKKSQDKQIKGILAHVFGSTAKYGKFQRQLLSSTVDNVGRAVVIPNPDLDMDSLGVPESMAFDVYRKYAVRRLHRHGIPIREALRHLEERTPLARDAIIKEMEERPAIMNRAPVLHKFGIMAFKPQMVSGDNVQVPALITKGYGMDFDGNCVDYDTELFFELTSDILQAETSDVAAWETLIMRLTGKTLVDFVDNDGAVFRTKIGEFPRTGKPKKTSRGQEVYSVPRGVRVVSYDHAAGTPILSPVTQFTVDRDHPCVLVTTSRKRSVTVSDNESLCVFDCQSGDLIKKRPRDAVGMLVPYVKWDPLIGTEYSRKIGWWYGVLVADGWVSRGTVGYSKNDDAKRLEFVKIARTLEPNFEVREHTEEKRKGKFSRSVKIHINCAALVQLVLQIIDPSFDPSNEERKALYKKIPDELLHDGSRECLLGLLAGLFDGDSTLGWNRVQVRPRFIAKFNTSSPFLVESIKTLLRKLGIRYSVITNPARGTSAESYTICPSIIDIHPVLAECRVVGAEERKAISEFLALPAPTQDNLDIVPISRDLAHCLADTIGSIDLTLYGACRKAIKTGSLGRATARRVLEYDVRSHEHWAGFEAVVCGNDIHWEAVKTVKPVKARDVFDLGVPETKVFALANGLVIYDTISLHVPASSDAVREAYERMLPSKNLISPADMSTPMAMPSQEYLAGLYTSTSPDQVSKRPVRHFRSKEDLKKAHARGDIGVNDPVEILG